ncbi:hypothetical protein DOTSEDRAFT_69535 [Dothistroma septosporum NZE10]|uniref:Uncharacterized protein n=1 Tax=Dothistroma septosporum (strain NZE10 / CBS 128990) TaxID=675120 RepID=N1PZ33_DOTSN|nr:hypothetical protein DOTSEDRAFT_69535 [Dothistroma septosporum NZE10]
MSYSMSPPAQKPPPAPHAPYQQAASPQAQSPYAPPPAKRQRLSPDARSPQSATSPYATTPNGLTGYGMPYGQPVQSPYSPSTAFAGSPPNSFNTPQPYQQQNLPWHQPIQLPQQRTSQSSPLAQNNDRGQMPPPPRPVKEEKEGVDEISDSLFGSGINLKDEENYLHSTWTNRHGANDSFASNQTNSFGSSTMGSNSFNMLTQETSFGSQGQNGAFAGTMGRELTQEQIEDEARRKRQQAARRKAETEQFPLNNQFLLGNCVRNRMHVLASEGAVKLNVGGVYVKNPEHETQTQVMVNGDGKQGVAAVDKAASKVEQGAPMEHIISLLSLAGAERLRSLVADAYGLARARRYGDHGRVVPPDFADIAEGEGKKSQNTVVPESITGTQWDKTEVEVNGETQTNGDRSTPQAAETVSFQGTLNARLRELADRDRKAEKERQKKREARKRKAAEAGDGTTTPADSAAEIPAARAGPVEAAAPVKVSKKEQNKKAKEAQAQEAQSFQSSNITAMHALGSKKNKYSWMTGGAQGSTANRFAKAGGSGTTTPKAQADAKPAAAAKEKEAEGSSWGDWKEDGVDGRGIQLRDWVLVLERDGREKKALQKAVNKLS